MNAEVLIKYTLPVRTQYVSFADKWENPLISSFHFDIENMLVNIKKNAWK